MKPRAEKAILWGIILASVLLAAILAWKVPFDGSNPDETSHLDYLRLLWEKKGPVTFTAGDPAYFETHQPPLYYVLALIPYALTNGNVFAIRLVATLIQIGTIWFAYRAGRDLFPSRPEVGLGTAAFVAFLPTLVQLSGAINNDGLTTLWCTALFWRMGLLIRDGTGRDVRGTVLTGLFFGAGLWTKLTVIQLIPALFVAALIAVRTGKMVMADAAKWLATVLAVGVVVASPWLIRNTVLYGDPLNIKIFPLTAGPDPMTPEKIMPLFGGTWADYWRNNAVRSFYTFFAILPPKGPNALRTPLLGLIPMLLLSLGGLVGAVRPAAQGGVKDSERRIVYFMLAGLLLIVPFFVRFNMQFFQAQGRYFLPALLPAALLCVVGWSVVLGKRSPFLGALLPGFVLFVLSLWQIASY